MGQGPPRPAQSSPGDDLPQRRRTAETSSNCCVKLKDPEFRRLRASIGTDEAIWRCPTAFYTACRIPFHGDACAAFGHRSTGGSQSLPFAEDVSEE